MSFVRAKAGRHRIVRAVLHCAIAAGIGPVQAKPRIDRFILVGNDFGLNRRRAMCMRECARNR